MQQISSSQYLIYFSMHLGVFPGGCKTAKFLESHSSILSSCDIDKIEPSKCFGSSDAFLIDPLQKLLLRLRFPVFADQTIPSTVVAICIDHN